MDLQDFESPSVEAEGADTGPAESAGEGTSQPAASRPWGQLPWQEGFAEPRDVPRDYRRREWGPPPSERRAWDYGSAEGPRSGYGGGPYGGRFEGPPPLEIGRPWTYRDRYYEEPELPPRPPRYRYGEPGREWRGTPEVGEEDWDWRGPGDESAGRYGAYGSGPEPLRPWRGAPYGGAGWYPYPHGTRGGGGWDAWRGPDPWGGYGAIYPPWSGDAAPWDPWFDDFWPGPY
jgi:hypothetical protein